MVGQDAIDRFDEWVNHADLKNKMRFIVIPRAGVASPTDDCWYMHAPHVYIRTGSQIPEVSSTQIRDALLRAINKPVGLNEDVWQYIQSRQLF